MSRKNPLTALALVLCATGASASSHREAPYIASQPKVDATDLYAFRSYEPGRQDFVTILANYIPFQDPQGGPNFHMFDPNALYEIHIDNNGDAVEDLTFQFRFTNTSKDQALAKVVAIPEVRDHLTAMGLTVAYQPQAAFAKRVQGYTQSWDKIIKASGYQAK